MQNCELSAKTGVLSELLNLIQPYNDLSYAWIPFCIEFDGAIDYQGAPPCASANDVIRWVDFTLRFVQAALACKPQRLQGIPATTVGLRYFMSGVKSGETGGKF